MTGFQDGETVNWSHNFICRKTESTRNRRAGLAKSGARPGLTQLNSAKISRATPSRPMMDLSFFRASICI